MVSLVLFLVILLFMDATASINLTYILKRDKDRLHPSCIAEELERYAAVGWVYPIPNDEHSMPNIITKFVPALENEYNCKFSKTDLCTKRWAIKAWEIDDNSTRTREFIGDSRWEDIPTLLVTNNTQEFKDRIDIDGISRIGLSVRAKGGVEIYICSGWNPNSYPCYYFSIHDKEIFLNKYLTKDTVEMKDSYMAFRSILSSADWRNFVIEFDDQKSITLRDIDLNRTVISYKDNEQLQPLYLLLKSYNTSLWKISQNNYFYTKTAQVSRLGPKLFLSSKNLCVSMFVMTCQNCQISFFYQNGPVRKNLKHVQSAKDWIEIKLKEENFEQDSAILFAETSFIDAESDKSDGFWAIDDVRVCDENEVKVSFLQLNDTYSGDIPEDIISCQIVTKPHWRPKKLLYDGIKDFPSVSATSNATSIKLMWKQEDPNMQLNYFISYQANDLCNSEEGYRSIKRVKSNGFLSTKYNEIVLENLVPYTSYNITISSVLHEKDKVLVVNTLETDEPTLDELPYKVQIRPLDTSVLVSWEKPNCTLVYGRIIYTIIISNDKLNYTRKIELEIDNSYKIDNLKPFTPYELQIITGRNARSIYRKENVRTLTLNFTTSAGLSPPVQNLEVYSVDENSASLRYKFAENLNGIPQDLQVRRCHSKCKAATYPVKKCKLWKHRYCIEVNYLIPFEKYSFKVSVRNADTKAFGEEAQVDNIFIGERVPAPPNNITFKIVDCQMTTDYCHLNVSWVHPYNQNGTITSFSIKLSTTDESRKAEGDITEVYRVENKTYLPKYTYQIKYIPYSTKYNLSIQSVNNKLRSKPSTIEVKTADIGEYIDQSPKLIANSDKVLIFQIPPLDRRLEYYKMTVIVQDFNTTKPVPLKIQQSSVGAHLCHNFGDTWISQTLKVENNGTNEITIGTKPKDTDRIKPNTQYCVIFIITNGYNGTEHDVVYTEKLVTPDASVPKEASASSYKYLYFLLLLALVPIGFIIYRFTRKRRRVPKSNQNNENVYESLPFEDCDTNGVSNQQYDSLVHK